MLAQGFSYFYDFLYFSAKFTPLYNFKTVKFLIFFAFVLNYSLLAKTDRHNFYP